MSATTIQKEIIAFFFPYFLLVIEIQETPYARYVNEDHLTFLERVLGEASPKKRPIIKLSSKVCLPNTRVVGYSCG
jgi:hypothetical protein